MRHIGRATLILALGLCAMMRAHVVRAEQPKGNFEVHDLSLWILEPGSAQANLRTAYPSAFPATVNSGRGAPSDAIARRISPVNLLTFYGSPAANLDVDLRTKAGTFLAHWPAAEGLPNRLRWSGTPALDLVEKIEDESELAFVDADHWIRKARQGQALFVRRGARAERFLAYDVELNLPAPVRLEGGPDKFTAINTSGTTLYDVLISRSTPEGRRVAWIDVLPAANKPAISARPVPAAKPGGSKPAIDVFGDGTLVEKASQGDDKAAPKADKDTAKPAAAKVSPKLFGGLGNKPATTVTKETPKDSGKETDKDKAADKPAENNVAQQAAAKKEAAQALPKVRVRITEFVPVATPVGGTVTPTPAAAAIPPGKGVEVTLSEPLPAGKPETAAQTTVALSERLTRAGLNADEIELFLGKYSPLFFEGEAVVVACRLDPGTIDEKVPLSVFPEPSKIVRVALVLMRNADPQLGSEVDRLVAQLGDSKFTVREAAHKRLAELGPLAFAALNGALNNNDLEIVIRCERILLNQNQTPNPQARPGQPVLPPAAPARAIRGLGGGAGAIIVN